MLVNSFINLLTNRVLGTNETPFFYASDIGEALGIKKVSKTIEGFDELDIVSPAVREQYGLVTYQRRGDAFRVNNRMTLLTEFGVYHLILISRSPIAKEFRTFVCELIQSRRRGEAEQLRISCATTVTELKAEYEAQSSGLRERLAEIDKYNPTVYVFKRKINGNPYDFVPTKEVDQELRKHQDDVETLYKCTTKPSPSDYTTYTVYARVFGCSEDIMDGIEGEHLFTAEDNMQSHTRYYIEKPEFEVGRVVKA